MTWQTIDPAHGFDYNRDSLSQTWQALHRFDRQPHPQSLSGDDAESADALLDAWCAHHNGQFEKACTLAQDIGAIAAPVYIRAAVAYTDYVCEDDETSQAVLQQAIEIGEQAVAERPVDANVHFTLALALGRYAQLISVVKALAKGLGGQIKQHLEHTLRLESEHTEANTAMGLYHAEIIDKVGATIGGLTHGAKKSKALAHFERSVELSDSSSAITLIEYANGLLLLNGDDDYDTACELYAQAAECEALDAVQSLDVAFAASQLEEE